MSKIFLLLLIVIVVLLASRRFGQRAGKVKARAERQAQQAQQAAASDSVSIDPRIDPQRMVACAHCGVYLPQTEALLEEKTANTDLATRDEARFFCSAAHRAAGPGTPS
jgi:Pyruvate/2-oxoacid:ferredoxin oxidoreductase delta subunit